MSYGRTPLSLLVLSLAVAPAALAQQRQAETKQAPPALALPVLTETQAWARAAYNLNYFFAAAILTGREHGQTPEAVGKKFGEIAAESWSIPTGVDPVAFFARGMAANLQIWPGAAPTVVEAKPGSVTLRYAPTFYRKGFADSNMPSGVTVTDFESFFQGLAAGLSGRLGLQVTITPEGEQLLYNVKQTNKPAP